MDPSPDLELMQPESKTRSYGTLEMIKAKTLIAGAVNILKFASPWCMVRHLSSLEEQVVGDIWCNFEAYKNLLIMCDRFGSRFALTEGERLAKDFIKEKFEEYGLENVEAEPFNYYGWKRGEAYLEVLEPFQKKMHAISLVLSPPTPKDGLEGEVIYLGSGSPQEFKEKKEEIDGKIVLCSSAASPDGKRYHRRTKYGYAVEYGAIGFIFMNHNPGMLPPTGSLRPAYRMAGEIPAIGISNEDGEFIIRNMKGGKLRVRIYNESQIVPNATSWNVVGEIVGSKYPENVVILGGHYDGHDISQGAMDNAAGVVSVMEVARALAKHKGSFKHTIRFIAFGAEELGVTGSTCYVDQHKEEIPKFDIMINVDGGGRFIRQNFDVHGPRELVPYLQRIADDIGYPMKVKTSLVTASDHWPFYLEGVPAASLQSVPDPLIEPMVRAMGRGWGHTPADTVDKIDPRAIKEASLVLSQFIIRISNEDEFPIKHTEKREILKYLEEKGVAEELKIQKKWHPESIR